MRCARFSWYRFRASRHSHCHAVGFSFIRRFGWTFELNTSHSSCSGGGQRERVGGGWSAASHQRCRSARHAFVVLPSIGALAVPIAALPLPILIWCGSSTSGFLTWTSSSPFS